MVHIALTPPSVSPVCVLQYIITYSSSCDGTTTNITVNPNMDPTQPVQVTIGGLDLCNCNYNFTAASIAKNGIGERSNPITIDKSGNL